MKFLTFPLTSKQKNWLTKLVNHENKEYWLSISDKEEEKIRWIIINECYSYMEQTFLNEITDYYVHNIDELGTLDNPK